MELTKFHKLSAGPSLAWPERHFSVRSFAMGVGDRRAGLKRTPGKLVCEAVRQWNFDLPESSARRRKQPRAVSIGRNILKFRRRLSY